MDKVSLQKKLLLTFASAFILATIFIFISFRENVVTSFEKIEEIFLDAEIESFLEKLNMHKDHLNDLATDWANSETIEELKKKVEVETLKLFDADGIIVADKKGNLIVEKVFPIYKDLIYPLVKNLDLENLSESPVFLKIKDKNLVVAVKKISNSNNYLIIFKVLTSAFLDNLDDSYLLVIKSSGKNIINSKVYKSKIIEGYLIKYYNISSLDTAIQIFTPDIKGNYILLSTVLAHRLIKEHITEVILSFIAIIFILFLILGAYTSFVIHKTVIEPIRTINNFLNKAIEEKNFTALIKDNFPAYEFESLKEKINLLFLTIQEQISKIKEQEELFRTISENLPAVIYLYDKRFIYVSSKIRDILEIDPEDFLGKPVEEFLKYVEPEGITKEEIIEAVKRRLSGLRFANRFFFKFKTKSGKEKYLMVIANTVFINNKPYGLGMVFDLTDRKLLEKQLEEQALTDSLTGLYNRTGFLKELERLVSLSSRENRKFFVLLMDLNKFKYINDQYGHDTGDKFLQEIGERLKKIFRKSDLVARLGGDEFAIVISSFKKEEDIIFILQKLISTLEQPIDLDSIYFRPTASIGIAEFPRDGMDCQSLLKRADIAMYKAKELSKSSGHSEFVFFSEELEANIKRKVEMENELERVLFEDNDELQVFYQPIVDKDLNIVKLEALIRWNSSKFGFVSPAEFVPLAEETGLITKLTDFVFKKVKLFLEETDKNIKVSVNVSPLDIVDDYFIDRLTFIFGNDTKRLNLEITENVFLEDNEKVKSTLSKVKELGIEISLDDFGTGYSSLTYLRKFPIDILKIDKSFIDNIVKNKEDINVLDAIIKIAKTMNMKTVVEGVETLSQFYVLQYMEVDLFQGYLFSKPLPAEEVKNLIEKGKIVIDGI